jgi:hypothetical protein
MNQIMTRLDVTHSLEAELFFKKNSNRKNKFDTFDEKKVEDFQLLNLPTKITNNETTSTKNKNEKREQWENFSEYFLSIIGFVIDLGNVWR